MYVGSAMRGMQDMYVSIIACIVRMYVSRFLVATSQVQVHVHVRVRLQELRRQNLHEATTDGGV